MDEYEDDFPMMYEYDDYGYEPEYEDYEPSPYDGTTYSEE